MNESTIVTNEQARITTAIDDVKATLTGRNPSYKIPPASYVDIEILIAQMVLKAERARQAVDDERRIDEVRDTAGYAVLILGRLLSDIAVPTVNDNILSGEEFSMYSDGYHIGYAKAVDMSYVEGYNKALADHDLMIECDIGLILHGKQERKSP